MPAAHSRRCALPGRDLPDSTTRSGLRSARRSPADRDRLRIANVLAAQGRSAPTEPSSPIVTAAKARTSRARKLTRPPATLKPTRTVTKSRLGKARQLQRPAAATTSPTSTSRREQQHRRRVEKEVAEFEARVQDELGPARLNISYFSV